MDIRKKLLNFLDSTNKCFCIIGPSGTGKLYACEEVMKKKGIIYRIVDPSQGTVSFSTFTNCALSSVGYTTCVTVMVNANHFDFNPDVKFSDFLKSVPSSFKIVFIANEKTPEMACLPIEYVNLLSPKQMAKQLFLDQNWELNKAERYAQICEGDWRKLAIIEQILNKENIHDITELSEIEFQDLREIMISDGFLNEHPTRTSHRLFRATVDHNLIDSNVILWSERNMGILCDGLETMATMQEVSVTYDILSHEHSEIAQTYFARSAANLPRFTKRYDYNQFVNPFSKPCTKAVDCITNSYAPMNSFLRRVKNRLMLKKKEMEEPSQKIENKKRKKTPNAKAKPKSKTSKKRN